MINTGRGSAFYSSLEVPRAHSLLKFNSLLLSALISYRKDGCKVMGVFIPIFTITLLCTPEHVYSSTCLFFVLVARATYSYLYLNYTVSKRKIGSTHNLLVPTTACSTVQS